MYQQSPQFGAPPPSPSQPQQKGCLGRHWKWMVPVGCLGLIVVAAVATIGGIVFGSMAALRSTEAFEQAVARARAHPEVKSALGEPIEVGWLLTGVPGRFNDNTEGGRAHVRMGIPISGPNGRGRIDVIASKGTRDWEFSLLSVHVDGRQQPINLLGGPNPQWIESLPDEIRENIPRPPTPTPRRQ